MFDIPLLLPAPRHIDVKSQAETLSKNAQVVISNSDLLFEAQTAQSTLKRITGREWTIIVGTSAKHNDLFLDIDNSLPSQGYRLTHAADQAFEIHGADATGIYYGVLTLIQLLQHYGAALPQQEIHDHPDFAVRVSCWMSVGIGL